MKAIIGSGIYGLYAAVYLGKRCNDKIVVLEYERESMKRASYVNQARVHMGYHYPRSLSTAKKTAEYFRRFVKEYDFAIKKDFKQIYATSANFSWTDSQAFMKFCDSAGIKCCLVNPDDYFNSGMCDGAFFTNEYSYDARVLRDYFVEEISSMSNVDIVYGVRIKSISSNGERNIVIDTEQEVYEVSFVLNATYASTNQLSALAGNDLFDIKYELCEIILCDAGYRLKDIGITVMDGPFFSIMPFGRTGLHSLTAVSFTPHSTCYEKVPIFPCQKGLESYCSKEYLGNCDECPHQPASAWHYMYKLARKYLREDLDFRYVRSHYTIKPILTKSEVDDSRPTIIMQSSSISGFYSVLSGKFSTIFDLEFLLEKVLYD